MTYNQFVQAVENEIKEVLSEEALVSIYSVEKNDYMS